MAHGKLLILATISINLIGCASHSPYVSSSAMFSADPRTIPAQNAYALIYGLSKYNYYGLSREDKNQQQEAVFYALDNADNGEVVEWYNVKNNTYGKVKPVQSYPQGSGYCRTLFTLISVKNKHRTFTETACVEGGHEGWRFIRK